MENNNTNNKNQNSGCGKALLVIVIILALFYFISGRGSRSNNAANTTNSRNAASNIVNKINNSNSSKQSGKNNTDNKQHYQSYYDGSLGSCGDLKGTVLIVSIFVNDKNTSWDTSAEDLKTIAHTQENLKTATKYLQEQAAAYGSSVRFIYDWTAYPQLRYSATFASSDLVTTQGTYYSTQSGWIKKNVDIQALKDQFRADHVVFINFFDTPASNPVHCWSLGYSGFHEGGIDKYYIEFVNLYCGFSGYITMPSVYAHEILHAFGAHDLYYSNKHIPQSYVDHLKATQSKDIMYTVTADAVNITNIFTPLDAYYVGIGPEPEEVGYWKLSNSEH